MFIAQRVTGSPVVRPNPPPPPPFTHSGTLIIHRHLLKWTIVERRIHMLFMLFIFLIHTSFGLQTNHFIYIFTFEHYSLEGSCALRFQDATSNSFGYELIVLITSLRIRQATRNERIYQNRTRYYDIYRVVGNFLRVLILAVFTIFPAVRKNKNLPQTFFLGKINSRVNIL